MTMIIAVAMTAIEMIESVTSDRPPAAVADVQGADTRLLIASSPEPGSVVQGSIRSLHGKEALMVGVGSMTTIAGVSEGKMVGTGAYVSITSSKFVIISASTLGAVSFFGKRASKKPLVTHETELTRIHDSETGPLMQAVKRSRKMEN